ncbi:T9SS type B sorting domain-containing protein [Kaistella flava (ex Peng et al. 2021)]|uniref:T9SS type B sorting domain-containing protein n=1 Tax=Kaistella flava (ex Peng et al. 2021) TaxID=2038776 RepID=UPI0018819877|nr:T9SS type B sorting domain-containing protein [Kaistella flava (ex Peng et al. 2021)]
MKTTFPEFHETTIYAVSKENFTPYGAFNEGTSVGADADDLFINRIKLPFNFCYFGNNYREFVIGSNGVITFDTGQLGKVNYPNVDYLNPSSALPKNMIFGVFSDLVFSKNNDSEIYYRVTGTAPYRKFIINFYKGRLLGCNQTVTSQIVLSESSNEVEAFVENKPLSCSDSKFKNALLGVINADGTKGYSPPERNTGVWESNNEAWKFTPSGSTIIPEISWYNSNNENIGEGDTVTVCPDKNEIYKVKIKYKICGNLDLILEGSSSVTFAADFPVANNHTEIFCNGNSFNVNLRNYVSKLTPQNPSILLLSFHNSISDAQNNINPQPENFVLTENKTFYVRVQNASDPTCFRTSVLNLQLISSSLLTDLVSICDINNDGIEKNYQLSTLNSQLLSSPINGSIHYFLSQADADNNRNEIKVINVIDNLKLYLKYKTPTCSQIFGPITLNLTPSPVVNSPIDFQFTTCDFKRDFVEPFNFLEIIGPLITNDSEVIIRFYDTNQKAYSGVGSTLTTIKEGKYAIYSRVEIPGGCFSIAVINLDITFTKVESKNSEVYICFDGTEDITINIDHYAPAMLLDSPIGISTSYFLSEADAENDRNPITNLQTITGNGNLVTKSFFVKFKDSTGCYAVKALKVSLIHLIINQSNFDICDFHNDGKEDVILSTLNKKITGAQNATVSYFTSFSDAQSNSNPKSIYNVQNSARLFVRLQSYDCSEVFEININLVKTPVVKLNFDTVRNAVCDNNNDGQEPFDLRTVQSQIYNGIDPVTFQYYKRYNPTDNSLSDLIATPSSFIATESNVVYAKVSFTSGCYSVSTINIKLSFLPTIVLKPAILQKCDYKFDLNETFNLNDALPQLFIQSENTIPRGDLLVTYYKTEDDANAGNSAAQINATVITVKSKITFWARFTSKSTSCYSVSPIELQTYFPPKGRNSVIADLCDDNLDGFYDVNLTSYIDNMVYTKSDDNNFTFFFTKAEAETFTNQIAHPDQFKIKPSLTRIWVRVENIAGCFDTAFVDFDFGKKMTFNNDGPFTVKNVCDVGNDGREKVNLTQFENLIYNSQANYVYYPTVLDLNNDTNRISTPQEYVFDEKIGPKKIYAKVSTSGFCPNLVQINLTLKKGPVFSLPDYFFCAEGHVDIKPDFSNLDIIGFKWFDPDGKELSTNQELLGIKKEGTYQLNLTASNGCSTLINFKVSIKETPVIVNLVANGNSYTVIATGSKKILYSIDGLNYQETNVFYNLPYGVITFYVKFEDSDCNPQIKKGLVLNIKNAFSPNDDGINDTWIIDDLNVFDGQKTNLKVFNRFKEKIFEQESATRLEWNGKTLGRVVPSDSYWYVLTLSDGSVFTGWVLLKNRH